jgi:hypothetical protein
MSKEWIEEEFRVATKAMKAASLFSYEEFCAHLNKTTIHSLLQERR